MAGSIGSSTSLPATATSASGGGVGSILYDLGKDAAGELASVGSSIMTKVNEELASLSQEMANGKTDPAAVQKVNNQAWIATTIIEESRKAQDYQERAVQAWTSR